MGGNRQNGMSLYEEAQAALAAERAQQQLAEQARLQAEKDQRELDQDTEQIRQHLEEEQRKQAEKLTPARQAVLEERQTGNGGPAERLVSTDQAKQTLREAAHEGGRVAAATPEPESDSSKGKPSEYRFVPIAIPKPDKGPGFAPPIRNPSLHDQAVTAVPRLTPEQLTAEIEAAETKRQENLAKLDGSKVRSLLNDRDDR